MTDSIARLYDAVIAARGADPAKSRTARLLRAGRAKMAKKLAEEAVEVVIDAMHGQPEAAHLAGKFAGILRLEVPAGQEASLVAALRAVEKAAALIDLTRHQGAHPRIGATDVVPFIPIEGVTLEALEGRFSSTPAINERLVELRRYFDHLERLAVRDWVTIDLTIVCS